MIASKHSHHRFSPNHLLQCYDAEPMVHQLIGEYTGAPDEVKNRKFQVSEFPITSHFSSCALGFLLLTFR